MSTQEKSFLSLFSLCKYFICLSTTCFGGPIALVNQMNIDLIEKKKWFSKEEFQNGLAFSKVFPGPLALQLGLYLAYLRYKILGTTLIFCSFVIPPCFIVLVISYFYIQYHGLFWIQAFLYGVSPCVVAIVLKSATNLSLSSIGKDITLWILFLLVLISSIFTSFNITMVIITLSLLFIFFKSKSTKTLIYFPLFGFNNLSNPTLINICIFFFSAGILVFGSGFAIIPFIYDGVVKHYGWISEKQFLDAVAIGMITPGPVLVMVTFIGYLILGLKGAIFSTLAIFLPVYLFVIFLSPLYNKLANNNNIKNFIGAATACVCGAIFHSCFILIHQAIIDIRTFIILLISLVLVINSKKNIEPLMILFFGIIGVFLKNY